MKKVIAVIILFMSTLSGAQIFDVETIVFSGEDDNRINLVILSEGYQESELDDFITDATSFTNDMFSESPFAEYKNHFNVYAIKVPSNESGADHPGTGAASHEAGWPVPITTVDTYFNATYDAFGNHFLLYYEIDGFNANNTRSKIVNLLANNFPTYDQTLILVNSPYYGGSGGEFPMASTDSNSSELALHELGHSLFDLKDEYYPGDILAAEAINMTQETNPSLVKWKNWMGTKGIDINQHSGSGNASLWYKPRHGECKMEVLGKPFCSVCMEGMIEKIYDLVSPIDAFTPNSNTVNNPTFPLDFELNLVKPIPNTLNSTWTLNNTNIANDVDDVSISEIDLTEGENTLSVSILDNTDKLKIDNHETLNVHTVTWTINYSTLGIEDIVSEENRYKINMFPNPVNDFLHFEIESDMHSKLKVDLMSLDGKKVKSVRLKSLTKINTSRLDAGIYIANIFSDNVLIASKKVVKN